MAETVIIAGARTPIGKLLGSLASQSAAQLGGVAIAGALERAGIGGADVDYVVMGHVIQAGAGQNPARTAALAGGIPASTPSITVNKVCLSGLNAVATADQLIRAGQCEIVVAGGMESMSQAPHLLPSSRTGIKYGDAVIVDSMAHDALFDQATGQSMGALTESCNAGEVRVSREDQDRIAAASHQRAARAADAGVFAEEIVPVRIPQRKGDDVQVDSDEGIRPDASAEAMSRLRPAFSRDGTVTAGTASQISDGAAALVVMSKQKAQSLGLDWIAEIGAHGMVAGPDSSLQLQPANAIAKACGAEGIDPSGLDLIEINEAFAAVSAASTRELGVSEDIINVNGGAIALGHPVGMSGARILLHLALELGRRGGGTGAAALCGGGGQGDALILHVPVS